MNEIEGIVLSSIDYKEKSKIVYLYTPYGHESIKANGSKVSKNGLLAFTQTLNTVAYIKSSSKFPSLIEYNLVDNAFSLTNSIEKMDLIPIFIEIIKNIPEDSDHLKTYEFVKGILIEFKKTTEPKKLFCIFMIKMLYVFGVNPELKHCISCGSSEISYFSIISGGALCYKCSNKFDLKNYKLWYEYYYDKKAIDLYSDTNFNKLLIDIIKYYEYYVHLYFKINIDKKIK